MIGYVNKLIPMSLVDGPGNRTAIFFQGCNFNCQYCHNPETINHCRHCGVCVRSCPVGALTVVNGKVVWNRELCNHCDKCIKVCPYNSSPKIYEFTPDELTKLVKDFVPFIEGISTSGGECTLQYLFLTELYKQVRALGLTCLTDTNGSLDLSLPTYKEFVDSSDGFMLDVKAWDEQDHIDLIGVSNVNVKKNLKYLAQIDKLEEVRCVCLNVLDNEKTIRGIAETIGEEMKRKPLRIKVISYRHFGVRKKYQHLEAPDAQEMNRLKHLAEDLGFGQVVLI